MTAEDRLTIACANYLRYKYPDVLFTHVANERQTSPARGKKLKDMGVLAGWPDLMICKQSVNYVGLAIELKVKPNKPSKHQKLVLERLELNGWLALVVYDLDEFMQLIDGYISQDMSILKLMG